MDQDNETLVKNIQKSFLNLLNEHLPSKFLEKLKEKNKIKILSIGCGRFREAKPIFEYFRDFQDKLNLYGIDTNSELLKLAKQEKAILKHADASIQENFADWIIDGLFNLIIVRHPEITFNTDAFIKIFTNCLSMLEKDGYLLITTHFENEKESIKLLLKLLKYNLLTEIENANPPSIKRNSEVLFADKFLLIASV